MCKQNEACNGIVFLYTRALGIWRVERRLEAGDSHLGAYLGVVVSVFMVFCGIVKRVGRVGSEHFKALSLALLKYSRKSFYLLIELRYFGTFSLIQRFLHIRSLLVPVLLFYWINDFRRSLRAGVCVFAHPHNPDSLDRLRDCGIIGKCERRLVGWTA